MMGDGSLMRSGGETWGQVSPENVEKTGDSRPRISRGDPPGRPTRIQRALPKRLVRGQSEFLCPSGFCALHPGDEGFGGTVGATEDLTDLGKRQVLVEAKRHGRSLSPRQSLHSAPHLVPGVRVIRRAFDLLPRVLTVEPFAFDTRSPEPGAAQVHDGPAEIGVERIWSAKVGESPRGPDECFVRHVLGRLVICSEQPGERSRSSDMAPIRLCELGDSELLRQRLLHSCHTL
jgi:hypothetical protein